MTEVVVVMAVDVVVGSSHETLSAQSQERLFVLNLSRGEYFATKWLSFACK